MSNNHDGGIYGNFAGSPANIEVDGDEEVDEEEVVGEWKTWALSFTANHSFGGERCPLHDPERPPGWHSCPNMLAVPKTLHMNYLNIDWAQAGWLNGRRAVVTTRSDASLATVLR